MRTYQGPMASAAARGETTESLLGLGSDGEVVVDHGRLAVEQEVRVRRVGLEPGEQVVEQLDQPQPEGLERGVPLTVPVRVRDHCHSPRHLANLTPDGLHLSRGATP